MAFVLAAAVYRVYLAGSDARDRGTDHAPADAARALARDSYLPLHQPDVWFCQNFRTHRAPGRSNGGRRVRGPGQRQPDANVHEYSHVGTAAEPWDAEHHAGALLSSDECVA